MNPQLPSGVAPPGAFNPQAPVPPDGPLVAAARTLERAPGYLLTLLLGLLQASFEDPVSTALTMGSVALALATGSWQVGVATFFLGYVSVRTVNNIATSIGALAAAAGRDVANSIGNLAQAVRPPEQDHNLPWVPTQPPSQ